jgi:hypothetical protein
MLLRRAQGWGYSCGRRYIMTQRPFATCGIIVGNRLFQSPQSHDLQACHHIRDRSQLLLDLALFCHMLKKYGMWPVWRIHYDDVVVSGLYNVGTTMIMFLKSTLRHHTKTHPVPWS